MSLARSRPERGAGRGALGQRPAIHVSVASTTLALALLGQATAATPAPGQVQDAEWLPALRRLAATSSVVGREEPAAAAIRGMLEGLEIVEDRLGDLVVTIGSGAPRRLLVAPLDEPGYVVSRVTDDGYLRITPIGRPYLGALAHQSLEGNEATVVTGQGQVVGVVGSPSQHLTSFATTRVRAWEPFVWQDAWVDVGAETADEARDLGIRLTDTLTLVKRPTLLPGARIAAPSMRAKAAAVALAAAARRLADGEVRGTTVLAWTTLELLNGKGLEAVVREHGPFDEAWMYGRDFGFTEVEGRTVPATTPAPGSGVLVERETVQLPDATLAPHVDGTRYPATGGPDWGDADVRYLGLPASYPETPVETVAAADVAALADAWVRVAGGDGPASPPTIDREPAPATRDVAAGHDGLVETLGDLVSRYGVSGSEDAVRARVMERMPAWADPEVDAEGNVAFTVGEGPEHVVFVAHMDETGFRVAEILDDGRLRLRGSAGLAWIWEAQAALVHTASGPIPAVFEPREDAYDADTRAPRAPLTAWAGTDSREETEALGIRQGDPVTMPKRLLRIGPHRATARALDDRAGSTALLTAASRIDPAVLTRRITFAWSVREETGLDGAVALAARVREATLVVPIDTFVSSDAPREADRTAYAPLGAGAVLRVVESINFAPRREVDAMLALARERGIPVQLGMTSGGTDGQPFLAYGAPSLPISWPGRYSHSPIEVLDLRDLEALVDLIVAVATH